MTWETPYGPRVLHGCEGQLLRHALAAMVDTYELDAQAECDPAEYGVTLFDELPWPDRLCLLEHVGRSLFSPTTRPPNSSAVLDAAVAAIFNQIIHEIEFEIEMESDPSIPEQRGWRSLTAIAFAEAFQDEIEPQTSDEDADVSAAAYAPSELPEWLRDNLTSGEENSYPGLFEASENSFFDEDELDFDGLDDLGREGDEPFGPNADEEFGDDFDPEMNDLSNSIYDNPPTAECTNLEVWSEVIDALMDRILSDRDFDLADRFLDAPPSIAKELRTTLGISTDYFVTPAPILRDSPVRLVAKLRQMAGV